MHNVRPEKKTTDQEVQTRIYIRSNINRPDQPIIALSNRRCQTIITTEPDNSIHTICALFQFLPQQVIDKGGVREILLPRAPLLQWKLPLVSHEEVEQEQERHHKKVSILTDKDILVTNTKSALKKRESDNKLGEWAALLALSHPHMMADELVDKETQTYFTVRPHILGDEEIAHLAKESSLQTSLTFDPDASITAIQPNLTNEIDHYHEYISIITPKQYHAFSEEDVEQDIKEPAVEPIIVPKKDKFICGHNDSSDISCECPPTNATKDKEMDVNVENTMQTIAITNYQSPPSSAEVQHENDYSKKQTTFDEFIDMLLANLVDKSIPQDVKEVLYEEFAEFTASPSQLEDSNAETMKENSPEKYVNDAVFPNLTDNGAFEKVVSQIMNSCVYNIEDQLKRIMETFDTYQKDLKNLNNQLDNVQTHTNDIDSKQSERQYLPREASQEPSQNNRSIGEDAAIPPIEMQGDFSGNVHHEVDVLCECCNLTAGGAAVPTFENSPVSDGKSAITFDVIVSSDGIEVQNNTDNLPATGERVIRFSIVPSQPHVNQQGASTSNTFQTNAFEIHVSRPHIPIAEAKLPSDLYGNDLGTGPEYECTVVFPPNRIMRTSEDNLDINGTSQKIGMMFEQDADYVEPYIINVEDTTVPINMLQQQNKSKNAKMILKNIVPQENTECTTSIEIPWERITLQVMLVDEDEDEDEDEDKDEDEERKNGCCVDYIDPLCTRNFCPTTMFQKNDDGVEQYTVKFDDKHEEITIEDEVEKDEVEEDGVEKDEVEKDEMDYEPAIPLKIASTASIIEIYGSQLEILAKKEQEKQPKVQKAVKRDRVDRLVYDPRMERHNEPYMDYMYNHFPDDYMDGNCGSRTELPWEQLTLPTNAKIRKIKKTTSTSFLNKSDKSADNVSQCTGNTFMIRDVDNIYNAKHKNPKEDLISVIGLNLSYVTETVSNVFTVDGRASSQKSVSLYSAVSDFRYSAKRSPKNITLGINLEDGTISAIIAGSEVFEIASNRNNQGLSNFIIELKPVTQCTHKSEMQNIIKHKEGNTAGIISTISNMPTETQSLGNSVRIAPNTSTNLSQSMPEIPSKGNVVFPRYPVSGVASPRCNIKDTKSPISSNISRNIDPITSALDAYRAEMQPLREALDRLKEEVRELNVPQLMPNYYNGYPVPTQQYPTAGMTYPGPIVRHTTAVSNGCGTRTVTRMKPLFVQNIVGSQYNQPLYPPVQPSPGMPPMPYYLPSQQYPPVPYPVPGMVPYPHSPVNQQPSDLYSHHEYTPINPPSCKSRRRKKNRNKGGSIASKESQITGQLSNCKASCCTAKNKNRIENNIQTHYDPKDIVDDSSEVSVKATCYVINNKYKIEIATDQAPIVQKEMTTTETTHTSSETYMDALIQSTSSQQQNPSNPSAPQ